MRLELRTERSEEVREKGFVPGIFYGHGLETKHVQVDLMEITKAFSKHGLSYTFEVTLEDETHKVQMREVQKAPLQNEKIIHFDLYKIQ